LTVTGPGWLKAGKFRELLAAVTGLVSHNGGTQ
jgi:hypothetical protein